MKEKIIAWLMDLGERMFRFSRTLVARAYNEFGDDAMEIVIQIAVAHGKSKTGGEKFSLAKEMLKPHHFFPPLTSFGSHPQAIPARC